MLQRGPEDRDQLCPVSEQLLYADWDGRRLLVHV